MAKKIQKVYNHKKRIIGAQPANIKMIHPGMILWFHYKTENPTDPRPLVLCIWNEYDNYKIHGINLNYLTDFQIRGIMDEMSDRGEQVDDDLELTTTDQEEEEYDDNLPYRNQMKKPFTRLKLPTYKETAGNKEDGKPLSKSEAQTQMKRLYQSVLKKYVGRLNMYRTYNYPKIKVARVVEYDMGGLVK